jgi:hypothetical protein
VKLREHIWFTTSRAKSGWPRSGQTRIAVGATHGICRRICTTPSGSNVFCVRNRGLTPTAIHVLSLWDKATTADVLPPQKPKSEPVAFSQDEFKNDPLIQKALEVFKGRIVEVRA